jgi:mycothiol synthase
MQLTRRSYQQENDYWRIRAFLREVMHANDRREFSWHVARLDYWRWHVNENLEHMRLEDVIWLWEDAQGRIAAVLNPEGKADIHLQVHPGLRSPQLEEEMIATAEEHLAETAEGGRRKLLIWAGADDELRHGILTRRGYVKGSWPEYQRRRSLDLEIPEPSLVPGYALRALGDAGELPDRSWASWRAFHPDEPDERYEGWEWYHNIQRMPLYRRDLDVVGVAPDGKIASFCTIWYDDVTQRHISSR